MTIRDITAEESSGWGVHLQWCERVVVNGVNILSNGDNGVNSDGLDIDECSDVTVSEHQPLLSSAQSRTLTLRISP